MQAKKNLGNRRFFQKQNISEQVGFATLTSALGESCDLTKIGFTYHAKNIKHISKNDEEKSFFIVIPGFDPESWEILNQV